MQVVCVWVHYILSADTLVQLLRAKVTLEDVCGFYNHTAAMTRENSLLISEFRGTF